MPICALESIWHHRSHLSDNPRCGIRTVQVPLRTLIATGGDTNVVANVEYRIRCLDP